MNSRSQLKAEIASIIEDGAQMRFTIADDGTVNDFYGRSGLSTELTGAEQALYMKLQSELPGRIAQAIAKGDALDDQASTALMQAAELKAPAALSGPEAHRPKTSEAGLL